MALDGRITVDALFHDRDGTAAIKVVSLEDTKNYATGKVAIVSGTVGTTSVELWSSGGGVQFGGYKDSAGNAVSLGQVGRIALRASGNGARIEDLDLGVVELLSVNNEVAIGNNIGLALFVAAIDGTSAFTAILYGA